MAEKPWTPPRVRIIVLLFAFITAANAFDLWSTYHLIRVGRAEEANPIVRDALALGPCAAYFWKMAVIALATAPLAVLALKRRRAWIVFCLVALGFAALTVLHAYLLSLPSLR